MSHNVMPQAAGTDSASNGPAICIVASCIPLIMFGTILVLRAGFAMPVRALLELAGLSLLIVNVSGFAQNRKWYASGFAYSLYALLVLIGIGWLAPRPALAPMAAFLGLAGVICLARNVFCAFEKLRLPAVLGLLMLGLFLGAYAEGFYWSAEHQILYPEGIAAGADRIDVAEQTAIVNMISTYGVPSTGLDGLVKLKYHNGAFWIGEAFVKLCGLRAIDFVAFGYGLIVIPFYIAMFIKFAAELRSILRISPATLPIGAWVIAAVVIIGLIPHDGNLVRADYNVLILNSDSFMLGLALLFIFGGMAMTLYQSYSKNLLPESGLGKVMLAVMIPGALIFLGFVKITLMYSLLAVLGYLWLRVRGLRHWAYTSGLALSAIALLVMLHAETGANLTKISLFNFDRISPEWVPYFFVFHFVWAWILALVWMKHYGIHNLSDLKQAFHAKVSLPVEVVIVAAITGLIPFFVIYTNSGSWVYFTLFHALLAGGFILALQPQARFVQVRNRIADGTLPLAAMLIFLLLLAVAGNSVMATVGSAYRMLKCSGEIRALLAGKETSDWRAGLRQIAHPGSKRDLKSANRERVLDCLTEIGQWPRQQRQVTALYIPKTNRWYWDMRQFDTGTTPFIAPAFSRLAMVDGLPEYDDIGYAAIAWGYPQYQLPSHSEPPQENLEKAISDAHSDGFRQLLVFEDLTSSGCKIDKIDVD